MADIMSNKNNHLVHKAALYAITTLLFASACTLIVGACHTPGIEIIKTGPIFSYAGEDITYNYTVINTGDVPLCNINVSNDQCGPVSYTSGDENKNGELDVEEVWIFKCTYVPEFTHPEPLVNNATVTGEWNEKKVEDSDDFTIYPFKLRKKVFLYWDGENNEYIDYKDYETFFTINMSRNGENLNSISINEKINKYLWLSEGTYQFCEYNLPEGFEPVHECLSFTTGKDYPVLIHKNLITFDLSIVKNGPECVYHGDEVTYYYYVSNNGPASVTPRVEDDICGIPTYMGGDSNENGKIDIEETWTYIANYTVIEDCESFLNNTVTVIDEEGAGILPDGWWLGGDRNPDDNQDDWSVIVFCKPEEPEKSERPEEPEEPEYPEEPECPEEPKKPTEPKTSVTSTIVSSIGGTKPHADANGPYLGDVDVAIEFDGSGSYDTSGTIIYFGWAFGDGTTGEGKTVTHVYKNGGIYVVELTVQNDKGMWNTDTTQAHVVVPNRPPELLVISGPSCETNTKYSYVFGAYDPDNDNISYTIDWGDDTIEEIGFLPSGHLFSLLHSWDTPGDYNITIIASDAEYSAQASMIVHMDDNIADNIVIVLLGILALIALMLALMYGRKKKQK